MAKKLDALRSWSALVKELRAARRGHAGRSSSSGALASQLAKELARGGDAGRGPRRRAESTDAAVLVRVLGGAPTEEDERELRAAKRAGVPVVAVQTGTEGFDLPYVLATDVVTCRPGAGFPVEEIAAALAARLGEDGHGARRAPAGAARARRRRR